MDSDNGVCSLGDFIASLHEDEFAVCVRSLKPYGVCPRIQKLTITRLSYSKPAKHYKKSEGNPKRTGSDLNQLLCAQHTFPPHGYRCIYMVSKVLIECGHIYNYYMTRKSLLKRGHVCGYMASKSPRKLAHKCEVYDV